MNKKTIFVTTKGLIQLDENNEPTGVNSDREAISNIVRITEPVHIVYNKNNKRFELDAEEGDILVVFYEQVYPNPMILIHSKEWTENLEAYAEHEQLMKEKWANSSAGTESISCDAAC